ncbi:MAG: deoxyguanosinetriphosphate triphosphohydrolase [Eubacteriales bacterium]|nr:deoxyguanosinetriphosphate triphosphohydrolase [Eubacteriales bacterium]
MTIREQWEQHEAQWLSPYAVRSADTRGRQQPTPPCDVRTDFQRDRDRIIHCKGFRRLKFKTQVFLAPKGDHYRTRLTHTLEVSQVARTLARALHLNEDLTEAIALGHDLGHTPFGHIGEKTLDRLMPGGFEHNVQSLRMVDVLEKDGKGLNLTWEVRDGIRTHSGNDEPATLEGWCVRRADRIAYINHDIDDAIRGGVLKAFELPHRCVTVLGDTHSKRINTMILDVVQNSADQPYVRMSPEINEASEELRAFLFENVYNDSWRQEEEKRCDYVLSALYAHYVQNPSLMPAEYVQIVYQTGVDRAVCDFLACMTDRYATNDFTSIFVPNDFATR